MEYSNAVDVPECPKESKSNKHNFYSCYYYRCYSCCCCCCRFPFNYPQAYYTTNTYTLACSQPLIMLSSSCTYTRNQQVLLHLLLHLLNSAYILYLNIGWCMCVCCFFFLFFQQELIYVQVYSGF